MTRTLILTVLLAQAAFCQTTRTFRYANTTTSNDMGEIATTVRTIADIRQASLDDKQGTLTFGGTADQIAMAEWMFTSLDKPVNVPSDSAIHQYQPSSNPDDVVRIFYLKNTGSVQQLQEIVTTLRSVSNTRRMFTYNALHAVAVRATSSQIALVDWLINQFDLPADAPAATQQSRAKATHEYRPSGTSDDVVRVFYLPETATVQDFQKIVTNVRVTTSVRYAFTYNSIRAVALRGTADQMALAERLFRNNPTTAQTQR